jgi:nucleotide-binding universal stress UspA family protein
MNVFPPKRIAVAVDVSAPSRSAVEAAAVLARRWGSTLELLHVEQLPTELNAAPAPVIGAYWWPWADFHHWRKEKVLRWLKGFPARRVHAHSLPGWPPAMLSQLARRDAAPLLVMGTHGYAGLDRALFGSVAEAVVRRTKVPVLVVHERAARWNPRRILAPWNGQEYAAGALRAAAQWARRLNAKLEILHVAPDWVKEESVAAHLSRRLARLLPGTPRTALRVRKGDARQIILSAAENFDLLVLAAHRRPFSSDFIVGSTVERALRHCRVPVLAVPSTQARARRMELPPSAWLEGQPYIF